MMREFLAAFLLVVALAVAFSPETAAKWFYLFQSHLFELQMEAME